MQACLSGELENSEISAVVGLVVIHYAKEFDEALTLLLGYLRPIAIGANRQECIDPIPAAFQQRTMMRCTQKDDLLQL